MDQVHVIRHKVLVEGLSIRKTAKDLGVSRNTVRRYLTRSEPVRDEPQRRVKPVTDEAGPKIEQILRDEPLELIEKLAALVPPPRFNLVRYHGVLAPAARDRARVVPSSKSPEPAPVGDEPCRSEETKVGPRPRNYGWAELMRRVFEVDVLECPECQGPMRVLAAIHSPEAIRAILDCVGLPSRAPPIAPAAPGLGIDCEND